MYVLVNTRSFLFKAGGLLPNIMGVTEHWWVQGRSGGGGGGGGGGMIL